jgi:ribosomal protein S12
LSSLHEKLRALRTLLRYERDLEKLKSYNRELAIVTGKLHEEEMAPHQKKANTKVLTFPPKKPVRSA